MTTKSLTATLLLAGLMASAAPALAQSDPCKDLSKLPDLARLGDLSVELEAALRDLPQIRDLASHVRIPAPPRMRRQDRPRSPRTSGGPQQTEKFTRTFRVGAKGSLDLANMSGDIVVTGGTGEDIVVDAMKHTPQGADAQRQLQAVTIEAVERTGRVEVRTRYPEGTSNIRTSVDYNVTVPSGAAVNVHSMSGDIRVSNVKGTLRVDCVSGDVRIENADQLEAVKSMSGDVTVTGAAGSDVRVGTMNGNVTMRDVKVRGLDASTVSGDVKLTDVAADHATVKTFSGGVDYIGPFARGGRYEFTAHSGDVRLTPTSNTGFEINADTFSGEIQTTMPITLKEGQLQGRHVRHEIRGTYGDGSALVTVKTFSGGVIVGKRTGR